MEFVKKYGLITTLAVCSMGWADDFSFALVGGEDINVNEAYAAFLSSSGVLTPISSMPSGGVINSVAINGSGQGVIGGVGASGEPYIAFVTAPSATPAVIAPVPGNGEIRSVAINATGMALAGGVDFTGATPPYAAIVLSGSTTPTVVTPLPMSGDLYGVDINDSGTGLIGGYDLTGIFPAYAALVSPSGTATSLGPLPKGIIYAVALNNSGFGIIGGEDDTLPLPNFAAYAALTSPSGVVTPLAPVPMRSIIWSVDINDSGQAVIGGEDNNGVTPAYAAFVSSSGIVTQIALPSAMPFGVINGVAINSSGAALLGGSTRTMALPTPYAALVSSSGVVTELGPFLGLGEINAVAISEFGSGILAGQDFSVPTQPFYLALVSPSGVLTVIPPPSIHGEFLSTALSVAAAALTEIPTGGLSGNNLTFANYINEHAPYNAFYFVPALFDGTLADALESAVPTRNALSLFTADNNLFFLNNSFSRHSRDARQFRRDTLGSPSQKQSLALEGAWQENLVAWNSNKVAKAKLSKNKKTDTVKERPYQLWGEVIGALAYQKPQHQTPGFQPTTGGAVLAFDAHVTTHGRFGGGAAYTYTHIHEKGDAGDANINQEYLFIYGLWDNTRFYFDVAVWGGLFQTENLRKIEMTGFEFQSKSHPKGWQLSPHFEAGYDHTFHQTSITLEPFVMFDWVNNWQGRFKERGNSPFNVEQEKHYSSFLRSELGIRFYEAISFNTWRLVLQEKMSYVNKKPFKVGVVRAALVGAPGSFTVDTLTTTQNLGVGEMQFIFEPLDSRYPYGFIAYQGEFCPMYQSHQASLGICWSF